jgi:hypothetical protein
VDLENSECFKEHILLVKSLSEKVNQTFDLSRV